jgi:hypothetical protein
MYIIEMKNCILYEASKYRNKEIEESGLSQLINKEDKLASKKTLWEIRKG